MTEGNLKTAVHPETHKANWALDELGIRYGNADDQK